MRRADKTISFLGKRKSIQRRYRLSALQWDLVKRMLKRCYIHQMPHPKEQSLLGEIIKELTKND